MNYKEIIDKQIDHLDIYSKYIGEAVVPKKAIISPLRDERVPSFNVYWSARQQKYVWKDFGGNTGDVYKLLMEMYNCSFKDAVEKIAYDFNISLNPSRIKKSFLKLKKPRRINKIKKPSKYSFKEGDKEKMMNYISPYGISEETIYKYDGFFVSILTLIKEGSVNNFFNKKNGILGFNVDDKVKFYNPENKPKFLGNTSQETIFGYKQLSESNQDFILQSGGQKDTLCWYEMAGIFSICFNSESSNITANMELKLIKISPIHIIVLDDDELGNKKSKQFEEEGKIVIKLSDDPLFRRCKELNPDINDFADMCKVIISKLGKEKAKEIILKCRTVKEIRNVGKS